MKRGSNKFSQVDMALGFKPLSTHAQAHAQHCNIGKTDAYMHDTTHDHMQTGRHTCRHKCGTTHTPQTQTIATAMTMQTYAQHSLTNTNHP
eukprot:m.256341 g.256341  ORF g.256341 m.256341 type:complete len:91 (-) comp19171_c1_seq1:333-605(-)